MRSETKQPKLWCWFERSWIVCLCIHRPHHHHHHQRAVNDIEDFSLHNCNTNVLNLNENFSATGILNHAECFFLFANVITLLSPCVAYKLKRAEIEVLKFWYSFGFEKFVHFIFLLLLQMKVLRTISKSSREEKQQFPDSHQLNITRYCHHVRYTI